MPEQFQRLVDGRLDIGIGRASLAPPTVASELFRLDPLGVLVADGHAFAALSDVPVATFTLQFRLCRVKSSLRRLAEDP